MESNSNFYIKTNDLYIKLFKTKLEDYDYFVHKTMQYEINNFKCHVNFFINTKIDINKPKLLLIHGYGSSSTDYFKIIPLLLKYYNLILPDIIGMGLSCQKINNNEVSFDTNKNCIDFFLNYFDKLIKILKLNNYYIIAHSLGAYFITNYLANYEHTALKLFCLSPGGFNQADKDIEWEKANKMLNNIVPYFFKTLTSYTYKKIFDSKKSPYDLLFWPFRRVFVSRLFKKKCWNFTKNQSIILEDIFDLIFTQKPEGYKCLGYIFHYSMRSNYPLINIMDKIKIKIEIICGEKDWIDKNDIKENLKKFDKNLYSFHIINNSSHEIMFDNEIDLADHILKSINN